MDFRYDYNYIQNSFSYKKYEKNNNKIVKSELSMILSLNSSKFNITNNIIECKGKDTWTDHIFDRKHFLCYKTKNGLYSN